MEVFIGMIAAFGFSYAPVYWAQCLGQTMSVNQYQALYALLGIQFGGTLNQSFLLPNLAGRMLRGYGQGAGLHPVTMGQYAGAESVQANGVASVGFTLVANQIPGHTHPANFTPTTGTTNINIPASPGSGSIAVNPAPTIDVVAGSSGVNPAAGTNYWLTGVKSPSAGPVTTSAPTSTTKASLTGVNVTLDTSNYQPPIPSSTAAVTTVTGGSVSVQSQSSTTTPVAATGNCQTAVSLVSPFLGINFCIAVQGLFPMRD